MKNILTELNKIHKVASLEWDGKEVIIWIWDGNVKIPWRQHEFSKRRKTWKLFDRAYRYMVKLGKK